MYINTTYIYITLNVNKYVYIEIQPQFHPPQPPIWTHLGVRIARGGAEDQAADAAEAVDSHTFEEVMGSSMAQTVEVFFFYREKRVAKKVGRWYLIFCGNFCERDVKYFFCCLEFLDLHKKIRTWDFEGQLQNKIIR